MKNSPLDLGKMLPNWNKYKSVVRASKLGLATLAIAFSASPSRAGNGEIGPEMAKVNGWSIHRSVDGFNDTVSCTGVLQNGNEPVVQLSSPGIIYIETSSTGLSTLVQKRIDDGAPTTDLANSIAYKVPSLEYLTHRVRVQTYNSVRGLKFVDLDPQQSIAAHEAVAACKAGR